MGRGTDLKMAAAAQLVQQCRALCLPLPTHWKGPDTKELRFHGTRDWRFDIAWSDLSASVGGQPFLGREVSIIVPGPKLALEIDGGVFLWRPCPRCKGAPGQRCPICRGAGQVQGGRHNTGAGYRDDVEKLAEAMILGWYVFRCLPEQIKKGETIAWLERFFFAHHVVLPPSPRPRRTYPNDTHRRPDPISDPRRPDDPAGSSLRRPGDPTDRGRG